jgi:hypothetical protein
MNETLQKRVRSAAVAGWWTILIAAVWMTVSWCALLAILNTEPGWLLRLWGYRDTAGLHWQQVHEIVMYFFSAFKLMLFAFVIVTIWLTLWSRRLKREE